MRLRRRDVVATFVAAFALAAGPAQGLFEDHRAHLHKADAPRSEVARLAAASAPDGRLSDVPCEDGMADVFACDGIDLKSFVPLSEMFDANTDALAGGGLSDIWGWTDPETGDEYVLFGKTNGTAIYRITDPTDPAYLGELPNSGAQLIWHDIKIDDHWAFIVSESPGHGVKVFDLHQLRGLEETTAPSPLLYSSAYPVDGTAHNVVVEPGTDMMYVVGSGQVLGVGGACTSESVSTDNAGLHAIDVSNPMTPVYAGCYAGDGYIHDAHCAVYEGPDTEHEGRTICVTSNEDSVSVVDMTDPADGQLLSRTAADEYDRVSYSHQGWMSEDQRFYFHGDELDEQDHGLTTRTFVFDIRDLDDIAFHFVKDHGSTNIDHNMYTHRGLLFQSNYTAGLEVQDTARVAEGELPRVAFFDTYPEETSEPIFAGTWSNYPYFPSGTIAVTGIGEGLFLLQLQDHVVSDGTGGGPPDDRPGKGKGRDNGGGKGNGPKRTT